MELDWLAIVLRWAHILAAVMAAGGMIFVRLALLPTLAELPEETRAKVHAGVRSRWAKWVMISITLLLVSGLVNLALKEVKLQVSPLYHALIGVKLLLALAIFFLASALVGRSPALERFRARRGYWVGVTATLAVLVILISGVLRNIDLPKKDAAPTAHAAPRQRAESSSRTSLATSTRSAPAKAFHPGTALTSMA